MHISSYMITKRTLTLTCWEPSLATLQLKNVLLFCIRLNQKQAGHGVQVGEGAGGEVTLANSTSRQFLEAVVSNTVSSCVLFIPTDHAT